MNTNELNLQSQNSVKDIKEKKGNALQFNGIGISFYFIAKFFTLDWLYFVALSFIILAIWFWFLYAKSIRKHPNYKPKFLVGHGKMLLSLFASVVFIVVILDALSWI